jgi:signal transduction histidine kinase
VAGLGLTDIEERTRLLGGEARLVSGAPGGVRLEVDVPLTASAALVAS